MSGLWRWLRRSIMISRTGSRYSFLVSFTLSWFQHWHRAYVHLIRVANDSPCAEGFLRQRYIQKLYLTRQNQSGLPIKAKCLFLSFRISHEVAHEAHPWGESIMRLLFFLFQSTP
ncbi:hypothetical protein BDQ12DRAFT_440875 [Crucibulum laeve]|uniref:Uncharacterized protein n=1 Tax=Crucibulum laeve TaxID=68775 RepID=A0A5C3LLK5_9AGAR|nr:hypothetical protein BDQ12DRAFT_440875 [Crucibulum laeve]